MDTYLPHAHVELPIFPSKPRPNVLEKRARKDSKSKVDASGFKKQREIDSMFMVLFF